MRQGAGSCLVYSILPSGQRKLSSLLRGLGLQLFKNLSPEKSLATALVPATTKAWIRTPIATSLNLPRFQKLRMKLRVQGRDLQVAMTIRGASKSS